MKAKAAKCAKRNKATGTIKYSDWQFPDTLNPYQSTLAVSEETWNGIFEGLFIFDNHAHLTPQMAAQIPTIKNGGIKNGGKTIIINLKPNMHWSNGATITSKDVKFGWQVGMDKATGPACSGSCDIISKISTPSKYTAVLTLRSIYAPVLSYGMPPVWPTKWAGAWNNNPHDAATKLGQDASFSFENSSYPTNGAYQVTQFNKDDRIVLQPMKHYTTMTCGGQVKSLIFAFYSNKAAMIAAAANKETDVTQNYTSADLPALNGSKSYKVYANAGFSFEHLEFNLDPTYNGKPNPLANLKVRQALALALDKTGLIRSALGITASATKNIIAWTPFVNTPKLVQPFADKSIKGQWDPIAKKYVVSGSAQAVKDAKKLLSQTPYKGGFNLDFYTTTGNPVRAAQLNIATNSWHNNLGVSVTPNYVPATTLFADWDHNGTLDHGTFQVGMWGYLGSPDPDQWKYNMQSKFIDRKATTHAAINGNDAGIQNRAIDKAFNTAAHTLDTKVRAKNYATVQEQVNKNAYWVPLYFKPQIATANNKVGNFSNNPTQLGATWNVFAWKAKNS